MNDTTQCMHETSSCTCDYLLSHLIIISVLLGERLCFLIITLSDQFILRHFLPLLSFLLESSFLCPRTNKISSAYYLLFHGEIM